MQAWVNRLFRKRDLLVLIVGLAIMQILAALLINRFMFHPVKGGYDNTLDGYVNIGTNEGSVAARILGPKNGIKAILYCHGNAEDLTAIDGRFDGLVESGYTIATFDYPGYGLSDGKPDEAGCYRNAHMLYNWLINNRGFSPTNIVVVGYSIGTGVAVELATSEVVGGLWLEAAYLSAPRAVTRIRFLAIDPFPNCDRIRNVKCPIVMLHGTADSIIPYSQGRKLYDLSPEPKYFIPIENADHTDFIDMMGRDKYRDLLLHFLKHGQP